MLQIVFDGTLSICNPCWLRFYRALQARPVNDPLPQQVQEPLHQQVQEEPLPQQVQEEEVQEIVVNVQQQQNIGIMTIPGYLRVSNTARRCVFQNCRNVPANAVPKYVRLHLFRMNKLFIPKLARVCQPHMISNEWEDLLNVQIPLHEHFNSAHVLDIIELYEWKLERGTQLDFENIEEIDDNELHFYTGMDKIQFNRILNQTSLRDRTNSSATVLGLYLVKIRTGEPDERVASMFNMSRRTLERKLKIARECLSEEFVPRHLGLDHMTREDVIARNLTIPSHIFGGNQNEPAAILVCDGTYIYVQKSSNFLFQRKTYSLHKFRNLVKPFLIVCTDGYIVDVLGPYPAITTDAEIMSHMMQDAAWHWFLNANDIFILDRGFRDSIPAIEEHGYDAHMPPTRARGEQLSTVDANKSRLITMCRWVVETINGRFKKDFKIFRHVYFNVALTNMMTDFKITAALINATHRPYRDNAHAAQFINIIDENINRENELADYVIRNNLNRQRVAFMPLDANNPELRDFPQLTYDELLLFTLGIYHLKLAKSYCHEHMRPNGVYIMELYHRRELVENKILIRGRIQSRHIRAKRYYTYLLINPALQGRQSLEGYYCSCIHGRRTVGSCAHIASVVYFLSWAVYQDEFHTPAAFLDETILDLDAAE